MPTAAARHSIRLGTLFVTIQGVGIKSLDDALDRPQIVFLRSAALAGFLLPIVWRKGQIATSQPGMHVARGIVGIAAMCCMAFALLKAPLAD